MFCGTHCAPAPCMHSCGMMRSESRFGRSRAGLNKRAALFHPFPICCWCPLINLPFDESSFIYLPNMERSLFSPCQLLHLWCSVLQRFLWHISGSSVQGKGFVILLVVIGIYECERRKKERSFAGLCVVMWETKHTPASWATWSNHSLCIYQSLTWLCRNFSHCAFQCCFFSLSFTDIHLCTDLQYFNQAEAWFAAVHGIIVLCILIWANL